MASRFATVSKDEIVAVNEAAAPTNTKKVAKFGLLSICNEIIKSDPRNTVN